MDPDKIEVGDQVAVTFVDAQDQYAAVKGTVLYCPQATGDSWVIRTDDNVLMYIQLFESMMLTKKADATN